MLFGSIILDVIVGMLFIYLLLSLLCAAAGEYIEAKLNNRAKLLKKGIELLLNDTNGKGDDLAKQLYEHGLIRPLYRDATKLPSYIPSRTFALALWNMATGGTGGGVSTDLKQIRDTLERLPNEELRTALLTLIDEANGDLERARANIEQWYESAMDRVSGWYKRQAGFTMLALGIGMAAVINADTINLASALARDGALRSAVVRAAENRLAADDQNAPPQAAEYPELALQRAYADVSSLGLPIGWVRNTNENSSDLRRVPDSVPAWLIKIVGILLTGFAVSQGAPFWFDLLNRFMVIRSTVKPKEKSTEQPSKDRPAPKTEIEMEGDAETPKN
jgi:hypothetical protein